MIGGGGVFSKSCLLPFLVHAGALAFTPLLSHCRASRGYQPNVAIISANFSQFHTEYL